MFCLPIINLNKLFEKISRNATTSSVACITAAVTLKRFVNLQLVYGRVVRPSARREVFDPLPFARVTGLGLPLATVSVREAGEY
jgi:hypothetical protein